jgi:hypothetical protein
MQYRMYAGSNINGNSCNVVPPAKHFSMVDINSELRGLNRFHSECGRKMYNPDGSIRKYGLGNTAISTFDARANVAINPAVCPDVTRNLIFNSGIVRPVHPGYTLPTTSLGCGSSRS